MSIKLLANYPAAFVSGNKTLVIADTHIGIEYDLSQSGIRIHKQIERFKEILDKLIQQTKAKRLVILGDVKHKVPGASIQELRDIPKFLQYLSSKVEVVITKGNHDDFLETLLPPNVKLADSKGYKIGKYGFFHGHAWPGKELVKCDYLLMGHMQPSVEFRDKLGYRAREQVWLKGKLDTEIIKKKYGMKSTGKLNIIIFPAFNILSGSLDMIAKEELSGPLLTSNALDVNEMRTYLMDGTYLGILKHLRDKLRVRF